MKLAKIHITTLMAAMLLLAGCETPGAEITVPEVSTPVAVNMTRAEGAGGGNYQLLFWNGIKGVDAMETLTLPWFHSLKETPAGSEPIDGEVDFYNFDDNRAYGVTNSGENVYYAADNTPVHALGYYPDDSLTLSADYKTLTLTARDPNRPGLTDVTSTAIEQGTEKAPFISSKDNELQFAHTQVKLNFNYRRTENLNARIAEIWVTIPKEHLANKWTLTPDGYVASHDESLGTSGLVFASTRDFYEEKPKEHSMRHAIVADGGKSYKVSENPNLYVLPNSGMFSGEDGKQQYVSFQLDAVIISRLPNVPNKVYHKFVTVPLTEKESDTPWLDKVTAGDAFTITIVFDNNRIELLAKKTKWLFGGWITIPIDPSI